MHSQAGHTRQYTWKMLVSTWRQQQGSGPWFLLVGFISIRSWKRLFLSLLNYLCAATPFSLLCWYPSHEEKGWRMEYGTPSGCQTPWSLQQVNRWVLFPHWMRSSLASVIALKQMRTKGLSPILSTLHTGSPLLARRQCAWHPQNRTYSVL